MQASVLHLSMVIPAHFYGQTKTYNCGQRQNKTNTDVQDKTFLTILDAVVSGKSKNYCSSCKCLKLTTNNHLDIFTKLGSA